MSTRLRTNIDSLLSQRHLKSNHSDVEDSTRKLSQGKRITRAGDDAAALAISSKLTAHNKGKSQALRNANDAISMVQIAEGTLHETQMMIIRLRELAIQSSTGSINSNDRINLSLEFKQLKTEIQRMAKGTEMLGRKMFDGSNNSYEIQVDTNHNANNTIKIETFDLSQTINALGIYDAEIDTDHRARLSLVKLDYAQKMLSESRAKLGGYQSRFISAVNKLGHDQQNLSKANSNQVDADYADETAKLASSKIKEDASTATLAQANTQGSSALRLIG